MNCKPGDLAYVRGLWIDSPNHMKVVQCICRYDGPWSDEISKPGWEVEPPLLREDGLYQKQIADEYLRPINPGEGQDETLTWAPVPGKLVTA